MSLLIALTAGDAFGHAVADGSLLLAVPVAVLAGLVSFASPCVLPLLPGYLAYLGSLAATDAAAPHPSRAPSSARVRGKLTERGGNVPRTGRVSPALDDEAPAPGPPRRRLVGAVVLFVAGFGTVFVLLGVVAGGLGAALARWQDPVSRVLGLVVVVLGLGFLGLVPALQRERRVHLTPRAGLWGAPVLGLTFGLGWVPCIGPTLAAIITLAYTGGSAGRGALLAVAFCVGLGMPFVLVALGVERSARATAFLRRHRLAVLRAGGGMLVVLGLLLVTGLWGQAAAWLQGLLTGADGFVPAV